MGCDGGTIPRRDELVKQKQKPEEKDKHAALACRWRYCCLSQELLQDPIVACRKGYLYNKTAVIEHLLNKNAPRHIRSLKDVRNLTLTKNPAYVSIAANRVSIEALPGAYICPVTGLEFTGKHSFVALWTCGCVFSDRILKEVKSNACVSCFKAFTKDDVLVLNGDDSDETPDMSESVKKRKFSNLIKTQKVN